MQDIHFRTVLAVVGLAIGLQIISFATHKSPVREAAILRDQIVADSTEPIRQIAALRDVLESLSDQRNTFGRDLFDPQRHTLNLLRQVQRPFILVLGDSITQRAPSAAWSSSG